MCWSMVGVDIGIGDYFMAMAMTGTMAIHIKVMAILF